MVFYNPKLNTNPEINPDNMTFQQLLAYRGRDMKNVSTTWRNFRRFGRPMLITSTVVILSTYYYGNQAVQNIIYGDNNKGGEILSLKTRYKQNDFDYGREFQRMNYLSEPDMKRDTNRNIELAILKEGGKFDLSAPISDTRKKAPHYKYY